MECAEALAYMHSYMYTHVIHGDIKPDNILLDDSICAKLSDFGISRLINTDSSVYTEHVIGSRGYMDPLFVRDGCLTVKSDVYSFGVVLLELITRKKPTTEDGKAGIVYLFTDALLKGPRGVRELFDVEISNQNNMKTLEGVAKLAGECLRMERDKRPEMIGMAERLRMLRKTLLQGQQQVDLFSWLRKSKSAPAAMASTTTISPSDVPTVTPTSSMTSSSQCRRFSHIKMKAATRNFDESLLVGEGEFGRVYRGEIDGGATMVAIKRLWSIQKKIKCLFYPPDDGGCEFRTIMEKRSKLCHRHIVPLIGYCNDNDQMMLVYKYMARGSLREQLFNTQKPPLTWIQRLEICIGAARGLDYLHRGADHDAIIHRNVKLSNILLDEEWDALISDNLETDTSEVFIGAMSPALLYMLPAGIASEQMSITSVLCYLRFFVVVLISTAAFLGNNSTW
ncbi:hypothetical protein PR202_gn00397 [Eleusine coracana subsp. coracana]|uniref:Protein kinase domain-containing protein n=1 Tax=Eleusine coracana subsp. coracana TaxID=191504 RepID=A0AAV5G1H8_ELECO|nr:hypothetical protein PR202_gn00397 [Eleusine coracana subsp. coracana]